MRWSNDARAAWALALAAAAACGGNSGGGGGDGGMGSGSADACVGLECQIVNCAAQGRRSTTLTGVVHAPNGTLPLYGVSVYVPRQPLDPPKAGVECSRCSDDLPGAPLVVTVTDDQGRFRLEDVPAGENIPLVIATGKWRRQLVVPRVAACEEAPLATADTRLPRTKAEGDMPLIAITTGDADTMECLPRKLGIADSEITRGDGPGRVHLYAGDGTPRLRAGFAGAAAPTALLPAEPFWSSLDALKKYDVVILSCEGIQVASPQQDATPKTQAALDAMKAYADLGGRVFASHWHNIWVSGRFQAGGTTPTQPAWASVATWGDDQDFNQPITDVVDEVSNRKGSAFADWMVRVGGSTVRGEISVTEARTTSTALDMTKVERWVYTKGQAQPAVPANRAQMFQFSTPLESPPAARCGKVVFTDMHVSGQGGAGDYPSNCVGGADNLTLTPQEKALAFMFFDISTCVGPIL
jgi:hypothetical protein